MIAAVVRIAVTRLRPSGDVIVDCAVEKAGKDSTTHTMTTMRKANGTAQCNPYSRAYNSVVPWELR